MFTVVLRVNLEEDQISFAIQTAIPLLQRPSLYCVVHQKHFWVEMESIFRPIHEMHMMAVTQRILVRAVHNREDPFHWLINVCFVVLRNRRVKSVWIVERGLWRVFIATSSSEVYDHEIFGHARSPRFHVEAMVVVKIRRHPRKIGIYFYDLAEKKIKTHLSKLNIEFAGCMLNVKQIPCFVRIVLIGMSYPKTKDPKTQFENHSNSCAFSARLLASSCPHQYLLGSS